MPTNDEFKVYREALAAELQPAMGCTEPIALAYAAAEVGKRLGGYPEAIDVEVSRNIVKNVKSVIVPNTGGLSGIEAAVAAGLVCRRPEARLQVLADVSNTERAEIRERAELPMTVRQSHEPDVFFHQGDGEPRRENRGSDNTHIPHQHHPDRRKRRDDTFKRRCLR